MDHLQKIKKDYKNLKKQEIQDLFLQTNYIKPVYNMTSHKILCDKALNIPETLKNDGYQTVLLLWYINVLIKNICLVEQ